MSDPIRLLILEDRPADAVLMASALEAAGYTVDWVRVEQPDQFSAQLARNPDIILADYSLPSMTALDAIASVKASGADIPVIVVTGALGDEAAAECLRLGASDYILKDRLARLDRAVRSALSNRDLRRAQRDAVEALARSEERFRRIFAHSPIGLALLDTQGQIVSANPNLCATLGLQETDIVGSRFTDILTERSRYQSLFEDACRNGQSGRMVTLLERDGQERLWLALTVALLSPPTQASGHALVMVEDVTERVVADRTAQRRNAIVQAVAQAAERFLGNDDWDSTIQRFLELVGTAADAAVVAVADRPTSDTVRIHQWWTENRQLSPADILAAIDTAVRNRLKEWSIDPYVTASEVPITPGPVLTPFGRHVLILAPVFVRHRLWGCLAFLSRPDVVWQSEEASAFASAAELLVDAIQDRDASLALRASEERTRLLIDTSLDAVISTDNDGFITGWNPQAERMFEYSASEVMGTPVLSVIAPARHHAAWRTAGVHSIERIRRKPHRFESVAVRRSGEEFPVEVSVSFASLNGSAMLSLFVRDVSDQRRDQAALLEARIHDEAIAERIQKTLLIGDPAIRTDWLQMAAAAQPGSVISGDFVLGLCLSESVVDVLVGDVMGKGLTAALLGAITKNYFHEAVRQLTRHLAPFQRLPSPSEIVASVHQHMSAELMGMDSFVTLSYARFDRTTWRCTIIDCGHTEIVHFSRTEGLCRLVKGDNLPLGILNHEVFAPVQVRFAPGDRFLFYSDGVIEAEDPNLNVFGVERAIQTVLRHASASPGEIVAHLQEAVVEFRESAPPGDDITCMAVQIQDEPAEEPDHIRTLEVSGDREELGQVSDFIVSFCQSLQPPSFGAAEVDRLALAAHEAARNVIEHAHAHHPEFTTQIIAEAFADRIELRIYDAGAGFNLSAVPLPELGTDRPQALGVYFIRQGVDETDYLRDNLGRNVLRLVKRRLPTGPDPSES
ncbi:MAG: SpoIIE family protein phosphatase [Chthonomonadales bacterium]|nr:SpoIIE family protein phosphatase [Chthonomonadales bacterium]